MRNRISDRRPESHIFQRHIACQTTQRTYNIFQNGCFNPKNSCNVARCHIKSQKCKVLVQSPAERTLTEKPWLLTIARFYEIVFSTLSSEKWMFWEIYKINWYNIHVSERGVHRLGALLASGYSTKKGKRVLKYPSQMLCMTLNLNCGICGVWARTGAETFTSAFERLRWTVETFISIMTRYKK